MNDTPTPRTNAAEAKDHAAIMAYDAMAYDAMRICLGLKSQNFHAGDVLTWMRLMADSSGTLERENDRLRKISTDMLDALKALSPFFQRLHVWEICQANETMREAEQALAAPEPLVALYAHECLNFAEKLEAELNAKAQETDRLKREVKEVRETCGSAVIAQHEAVKRLEATEAERDTLKAQLDEFKSKPRTERCHECNVFVSDWVEDDQRNGRICRPCESLRIRTAQLNEARAALAHYARRYEGKHCWNWRKEVCDSFSGEQSHFDWIGEEADEPWEVAEKALAKLTP